MKKIDFPAYDWKYKLTIFVAIFSMAAVPIATIPFVKPGSDMPIYAAGYTVLFWTLILCFFFWRIIWGIVTDKFKRLKEMENGGLKLKKGMVFDEELLLPKNHDKLINALSIAVNGDRAALKRVHWRSSKAAILIVLWVTIFLCLVPFVIIIKMNPYVVIYWLGVLFLFIPLFWMRDVIMNDEYFFESRAIGLNMDKSSRIASGKRHGRQEEIHFMDHAIEVTVHADAGNFTAKVSSKVWKIAGKPTGGAVDFLETLKEVKKIWPNVEITSDGKTVKLMRRFDRMNEMKNDPEYWFCDVWLGEWLAEKANSF